jgi:hypothetical protein
MIKLLLATTLVIAQAPTYTPKSPVRATDVTAKEDPAVTALALKIYDQMRAGKVDAALLTDSMNHALSPDALAQQKPIFDQLGEPMKLTLEISSKVADGTSWKYLAVFATAQLHVTIVVMTDGKVGGYALSL